MYGLVNINYSLPKVLLRQSDFSVRDTENYFIFLGKYD